MEKVKKSAGYSLALVGPGVRIRRSVPQEIAYRIAVLVLENRTATGSEGADDMPRMYDDDGSNISPKEFIAAKRPISDTERIACLAYYLYHHRSTPEFKTADLTKLNTEAAQRRFSNATVAVRNADNQGYLSPAGGHGRKQITTRGEAVIKALPDRAMVKDALNENPIGKRRRTARVRNPKAGR